MIHKWEFEDGTVVRWTDKGSVLVSGRSPLAQDIRTGIDLSGPVWVGLPPGGAVSLDALSVWLLDRYMRDAMLRNNVQLESTTYTPSDDDIPEEAAEIIASDKVWAESAADPPETIY